MIHDMHTLSTASRKNFLARTDRLNLILLSWLAALLETHPNQFVTGKQKGFFLCIFDWSFRLSGIAKHSQAFQDR